MKKIFLFLYILFYSSFTYSQETGRVYGKIVDAATKEPLIGVNILVLNTDYGTSTDLNGEYKISGLPINTYQIKASTIGYSTVTKTDIVVRASTPVQVDFNLTETIIELENITIKSGYFSNEPTDINSIRSFSYEEIRRIPGGFEDVIRALSVLPGVAQADPGRNDLIVRGGAPSENLYIVDGIEIPNINHFGTQGATGGPLSFINLDFVKETSFSTGGFSSLYGDKLSSVLKINLRKGREDRLGGKATISASQFGLNLEGPLGKNNSFLFSARRSYLDFIFKAAGFGFVPEYYDVTTKANFKLDNKNSISYLFIAAFDNVKFFNETSEQRFDNSRILGSDQIQYATGITYRHLIRSGFFDISLTRVFVDYNTQQRDINLNPVFKNISKEKENSLKADLVYKFSPGTEINLGAKVSLINFEADILLPSFETSFGDTLPFNSLVTDDQFTKASSYVNFNFNLINNLVTNIGLRLDYFDPINKKVYLNPRFSASYNFTALTSLNVSSGIYYQSPSYIWLALENNKERLTNIKAEHFIAGIDHLITEDALLKIEGFYKIYSDYPASLIRPYLILANTGAGFSGSDDNFSSFGLEPLTNKGKGLSRGAELSIQKKLSDLKYYGIISLTYSETEFTSIDGVERPGAYDQKLILNLSGGYKFNEKWEASLKFRYTSGRPYTPYEMDGSQLVSKYLTNYFEPLHSLDIRIDRHWYFEKLTLITYLDIQNIYNNKNSNSIRWDPRTQSIDDESSIGILPSIGVSLEF